MKTNHAPTVLTDRLALAFANDLRTAIGAEAYAEVIAENRRRWASGDRATCASHDHVDANECMDEAFRTVLGRGADADGDDVIWNAAWERFVEFPPP